MKDKIKYVSFLLAMIFIMTVFLLLGLKMTFNRYSYDDIPRQYIIGKITSISEQNGDIDLLLDNGESASATMTVNGKVKIYEIVDENVAAVDFSKLQIGSM